MKINSAVIDDRIRPTAAAEACGSPCETEYWMPPTITDAITTIPTPSDNNLIIAKTMSAIGLLILWSQPISIKV